MFLTILPLKICSSVSAKNPQHLSAFMHTFKHRLHVSLWFTDWLRLLIFRRPWESEPVDESTERRCQRRSGDLHLQQRRQATCGRRWIRPVQRRTPGQLRTESQRLWGPARSQWPVPLSGQERCQQERQQLPWGAPPCPVYVCWWYIQLTSSPLFVEKMQIRNHSLQTRLKINIPFTRHFTMEILSRKKWHTTIFFQTPCWDSLYGLCTWYRNNGMMMLFCQTPQRTFPSQWTRILMLGAAEWTWPAAVPLTPQQTRTPGTGGPLLTARRCRWDQDRCCLLPRWRRLTLDSTSAEPGAAWGRTTRLSCCWQWSTVCDTLTI